MNNGSDTWRVYHGLSRLDKRPADESEEQPVQTPSSIPDKHPLAQLPPPPPWRQFGAAHRDQIRGRVFQPSEQLIDVVNMALYLRRPLLITGKPGAGKSTLASAIAEELHLGPLLKWPISTRSTLHDGLYIYDAIRRLQDTQIYHLSDGRGSQGERTTVPRLDPIRDIGQYIKLGPLGTAMLPTAIPRALLIDEIDKSDIDLPNDLLNIFEEGEFEIREIRRHQALVRQETATVETADGDQVAISGDGKIRCDAFPVIVMTSNKERDFPPAFLRRCLRYEIPQPEATELEHIVEAHLGAKVKNGQLARIEGFVEQRRRHNDNLATDQLLNLIYLLTRDIELSPMAMKQIEQTLLRDLESGS